MANNGKYRVHEVAKDFGIPSKSITEILGTYSVKPRNLMQPLSESDLSIIFDYLTQHHQISNIQSIYDDTAKPEKRPGKAAPKADETPKEEDDSDDDGGIDNSELSGELHEQVNRFSLRLNPDSRGQERLETSRKILCKKFPLLRGLDPEECLPELLNKSFPDGMPRRLFIRTLSFGNSSQALLAIRPEVPPAGRLRDMLGDDDALLFRGRVQGRGFVVDRVEATANTGCLPFEVECVAAAYADVANVRHEDVQFLYTIRREAESLTQYTAEKLADWNEYLKWREKIVETQIKGCKYFQADVDEKNGRLIFHLVFDSPEQFRQFRKYLRRQDIQAFNNDYSANEWRFVYEKQEKRGKRYNRGVGLGRYCGVVAEYALPVGTDAADGNESALFREYETPYIVQAAFEPDSDDADRMKDLEDEEIVPYMKENVLPKYDAQGFLALSAVGDFIVIERMKKAVERFGKGESNSPNLGAWLFNITQARLPASTEYPVDRWLNDGIASNESQRKAVQGMICAEDVCLVQGPPGTGKTTVIAEAVYQMARQGKRILIASQSNDAVDNALERLADTPEIRAIRVGQAARRKNRKEDFVEGKFSPENSLRNYYHALAARIDEQWLRPWDDIRRAGQKCESDLRDLYFITRDMREFRQTDAALRERLQALDGEIRAARQKKAAADRRNGEIMAERDALEQFERLLFRDGQEPLLLPDGENVSFSLSAAQLSVVRECIAPFARDADGKGFRLLRYDLNPDALGLDGANNSLVLTFRRVSSLGRVKEKILRARREDSGQDVKAALLRDEIERLRRASEEEPDEDAAYRAHKQLRAKQRELKALGERHSEVGLTGEERELFNDRFPLDADDSAKSETAGIVDEILSGWGDCLREAVRRLRESLDARDIADIASLDAAIKRLEGQRYLAESERRENESRMSEKQGQLSTLAQEYGTAPDETALEERIRGTREENSRKARQHQQTQGEWEDTLRTFRERLGDEQLFPCDVAYYLNTYEDSCNVVGASCTDRVLAGQELGDFDVAIVDEVSKATPPELLLPLMKARKAILVGDHRQLPPLFEAHERSYREMAESEETPEEVRQLLTMDNFRRFEKMVTASLFKDMFERADESVKYALLTQYRMHSDIMNIINRFYDMRLQCGLSEEEENRLKSHGLAIPGRNGGYLISPDGHAYWLDSSFLPSGKPVYDNFYYGRGAEQRGTSAYNVMEVSLILALLRKMDEANRAAGGVRKTVGVISFYQRQINQLRAAVKKMRKELPTLDIDINTVDRFQGKEKQIIITSLVRNNPEARAGQHVVAFERINVAFSRAQELLVVVGARHMYEKLSVELPNMDRKGSRKVPVYQNIVDFLGRKACLKDSAKLLGPEEEQEILEECARIRRQSMEGGGER